MASNSGKEVRKIRTAQFGEFDVEPEFIFHFENGLLGFDDLREFVLISEESTLPFRWLLSVENPDIGFPLLSPWHIDLTYDPGKDFDLDRDVLMVVITLEDDNGQMTANLKAPIILDVNKQIGKQVILPSDKFTTNYLIKKNSSLE
jgi:flagellar assembly factor FliW